MKLSLSKIALFLIVALTTTVAAQEQGLTFNFFGGGARSEGMGQAYLGISNDGTAGGWNPAGLYVHEKTLMVFSYGVLLPRGRFTYFRESDIPYDYNHTGNFGSINYWNIISPLRVKNHHFVLNLAYNRAFDTYFKFGERLADASQTVEPNAFYERHGGINSINIGFGTRIYQQLSFGLSGNVYYGKVTTEELRSLWYDTTLFFTRYQYLSSVQVLDSTKYSGFNMTLGLLYSGETVRGGLIVRTPFDLKGESDSTLYRITTFNNVPMDNLTDTNYIDDRTSKIEIPLIVGLGLGYNLNENLLLAADVEYRNFSGKLVRNLDSLKLTAGGDRLEFFSSRDPNWSDVVQFRLGAEYILNTPIGEMPLRAGFRNEELPFGNAILREVRYEGPKNSSVNDSTRVAYIFNYDSDKITGYSISLGAGVRWSQVMLDVAYTYTTYKQKIYLDGSSNNDVFTDEDLKYRNYWKNHHLNFTFTGYF
ncbi:MAG: hypothetical protein AB1690_10700 [Candidatus Zixiibacteriota bacterium]